MNNTICNLVDMYWDAKDICEMKPGKHIGTISFEECKGMLNEDEFFSIVSVTQILEELHLKWSKLKTRIQSLREVR